MEFYRIKIFEFIDIKKTKIIIISVVFKKLLYLILKENLLCLSDNVL